MKKFEFQHNGAYKVANALSPFSVCDFGLAPVCLVISDSFKHVLLIISFLENLVVLAVLSGRHNVACHS